MEMAIVQPRNWTEPFVQSNCETRAVFSHEQLLGKLSYANKLKPN